MKILKFVYLLYIYIFIDELNLQVGDEIIEVGFVEPGWCQGNLNGKVGMFPDNFVDVCLFIVINILFFLLIIFKTCLLFNFFLFITF